MIRTTTFKFSDDASLNTFLAANNFTSYVIGFEHTVTVSHFSTLDNLERLDLVAEVIEDNGAAPA